MTLRHHNASQVSAGNTLCNICMNVKLPAQHSIERDGDIWLLMHVDSLARVFQTADCDLCAIIRTLWHYEQASGTWSGRSIEHSGVELGFYFKCGVAYENVEGEYEINISFRSKGSKYWGHSGKSPSWAKYLPSLRLAGLPWASRFASAFVLSPTCDLDRMKKYFEHCRARHEQYCEHPRNTPSKEAIHTPEFFRLINTQKLQIVTAGKDCEYATLSYVWDRESRKEYLTLTEASSKRLFGKGGLELSHLPQTVVDAIYVCQKMDIEFLWVDSLCIIQDDISDLRVQIGQMDHIYSLCSLTLVNASDGKPSDGIQCLRSRVPEQLTCQIDGVRCILAEPPLHDILYRSAWFSRGWTYQEFLLSKRMLVFTSSQAYFVCAVGTCAEDTEEEQLLEMPAPNLRNRHSLSAWRMPLANSDPAPTCWRLYRDILREYTERSLTYDSDILNAVSGCLRALGRFTGDTFIMGLPRNLFPVCLLWHPAASAHQRDDCDWPSWSWTGWKGQVWIPLDMYNLRLYQSIKTALQNLAFIGNDGTELSINQTPSKGELKLWMEDYIPDYNYIVRHISDSDIPASGRLRFSTQAVSLTLEPEAINDTEPSAATSLKQYRLHAASSWVGSVFLTSGQAALYLGSKSTWECLMLTSFASSDWDIRYYLEGLPVSNWKKNEPFLFDPKFYLAWSEHRGSSDSPLIGMNHVMLIKREGKCVERVAIGIIADCELNWHEEEFLLQ